LHAAALDAIVRHGQAASPRECCGMLLGRADEILEAIAARNLAEDPNRFFIDPQDHIDARRRARVAGLEIVGFYHSHPHSAAVPSPTDLAEATYPEQFHLIVGLGAERPEVRIFRLEHGNFAETPFVTVE
jgi:proteasome lid subunit RPN8/RPN11